MQKYYKSYGKKYYYKSYGKYYYRYVSGSLSILDQNKHRRFSKFDLEVTVFNFNIKQFTFSKPYYGYDSYGHGHGHHGHHHKKYDDYYGYY